MIYSLIAKITDGKWWSRRPVKQQSRKFSANRILPVQTPFYGDQGGVCIKNRSPQNGCPFPPHMALRIRPRPTHGGCFGFICGDPALFFRKIDPRKGIFGPFFAFFRYMWCIMNLLALNVAVEIPLQVVRSLKHSRCRANLTGWTCVEIPLQVVRSLKLLLK